MVYVKNLFSFFLPNMNPPLAPPLGLALLVLSTLVLVPAALPLAPVGALVVLDIVALIVLPPSLVQVVGSTPSCKLLSDIFISSSSLIWLIIYRIITAITS